LLHYFAVFFRTDTPSDLVLESTVAFENKLLLLTLTPNGFLNSIGELSPCTFDVSIIH